jgi:hypothetical protein
MGTWLWICCTWTRNTARVDELSPEFLQCVRQTADMPDLSAEVIGEACRDMHVTASERIHGHLDAMDRVDLSRSFCPRSRKPCLSVPWSRFRLILWNKAVLWTFHTFFPINFSFNSFQTLISCFRVQKVLQTQWENVSLLNTNFSLSLIIISMLIETGELILTVYWCV